MTGLYTENLLHREVKSIVARPDQLALGGVPSQYDGCGKPVQRKLRYNVSSRKERTWKNWEDGCDENWVNCSRADENTPGEGVMKWF